MVKTEENHVQPYLHILGALLLLFCLTFITVFVSRLNMGHVGIWISLTIAALKSSVVLIMFMHIKKEGKAVFISLLTLLFLLALVIGFLFLDISYRI